MNAEQQKITEEAVAYFREQGMTIDEDMAFSSGIRYCDSIQLGFSLESLKHIDDLLETLCRKKPMGPTPKDLFYLGYYVGEVLIRHTNAHWITDEKGSIKGPMIVELPDFLTVNPIIECWKRLRKGARESIERNCWAILRVRKRLEREQAKEAAPNVAERALAYIQKE